MPARDLSHPDLCLTLYFLSFLFYFLFYTPLWTHCQRVLIPNLVFIFSLLPLLFFFLFTLSFLHTPVVTPFLSHLMLLSRPLHLSHLFCAIRCHFYWFFYYLSAHGLLNSISIAALSVICCFFPPQHLTFLSSFSPLFAKCSLVLGHVSKSMYCQWFTTDILM